MILKVIFCLFSLAVSQWVNIDQQCFNSIAPLGVGNCKQTEYSCTGKSDIIFVLDSSGSISYDYGTAEGKCEFQKIMNFTGSIFCGLKIDPEFVRVAVIQFSSGSEGCAVTSFGFTDNKEEAFTKLRNMQKWQDDMTHLHEGLDAAYDLLSSSRDGIYKFVVTLSDGNSQCHSGGDTPCRSLDEPASARIFDDYDANVLAIAAGNDFNIDHLKNYVATYPSYFAEANSINSLNLILAKIIELTCVDVFSFTPSEACLGENATFTVVGTGFSDTSDIKCRMRRGSTLNIVDGKFKDKSHIICTFDWDYWNPKLVAGKYPVDVSLNGGKIWILDSANKEKKFQYKEYCIGKLAVLPILIGIFALLLCLLCLGVLLFCILCTFVMSVRPPVRHQELKKKRTRGNRLYDEIDRRKKKGRKRKKRRK